MNISEFQQKIERAGKPIVVDFWAEWCMPCRATKPILDRLASEYGGKVEFMPIDADDSPKLLAQFQVIGIPTMLILRDSSVIGRVTGAQTEAGYRAMFESLANGLEMKTTVAPFERLLRLGAGALLVLVGLSTGSWLVGVIGAGIAFLGVYDRCPVWKALTGMIQRK